MADGKEQLTANPYFAVCKETQMGAPTRIHFSPRTPHPPIPPIPLSLIPKPHHNLSPTPDPISPSIPSLPHTLRLVPCSSTSVGRPASPSLEQRPARDLPPPPLLINRHRSTPPLPSVSRRPTRDLPRPPRPRPGAFSSSLAPQPPLVDPASPAREPPPVLVNLRRPSTRQVLWHAEGAVAGDDGAVAGDDGAVDEHPRDDERRDGHEEEGPGAALLPRGTRIRFEAAGDEIWGSMAPWSTLPEDHHSPPLARRP
ncbi:vegetative cell wall protein gp1-like [Triticum urartu]|uniref:vegetative cell wall protein gp1-like n=1 Tax=Triticum urartu TaxID=4572 RepID=UPI002042E975|nr:vegetative cell wall protein gp1-like [Triticum urartu]